MFILRRQFCNPHFFKKCCHFCWLCFDFSENENSFERNEVCAIDFLKWTNFNFFIFNKHLRISYLNTKFNYFEWRFLIFDYFGKLYLLSKHRKARFLKLYKCYIVRQCSSVSDRPRDEHLRSNGKFRIWHSSSSSSLILNMNRRPTLVSQKMPKDY